MLLEDILLAVALGAGLLVFGVPLVRFLKVIPWRRKDPLAEAHERLRLAKIEAEVARVNREAERIYEGLYQETLADDGGAAGARVVADPPEVPAPNESTEKGKKHGSE
jgi:hypothetical protein